jgi:hypothetical protein
MPTTSKHTNAEPRPAASSPTKADLPITADDLDREPQRAGHSVSERMGVRAWLQRHFRRRMRSGSHLHPFPLGPVPTYTRGLRSVRPLGGVRGLLWPGVRAPHRGGEYAAGTQRVPHAAMDRRLGALAGRPRQRIG